MRLDNRKILTFKGGQLEQGFDKGFMLHVDMPGATQYPPKFVLKNKVEGEGFFRDCSTWDECMFQLWQPGDGIYSIALTLLNSNGSLAEKSKGS
jgi:hypothetical protein